MLKGLLICVLVLIIGGFSSGNIPRIPPELNQYPVKQYQNYHRIKDEIYHKYKVHENPEKQQEADYEISEKIKRLIWEQVNQEPPLERVHRRLHYVIICISIAFILYCFAMTVFKSN